jgi:hypothetical protein
MKGGGGTRVDELRVYADGAEVDKVRLGALADGQPHHQREEGGAVAGRREKGRDAEALLTQLEDGSGWSARDDEGREALGVHRE